MSPLRLALTLGLAVAMLHGGHAHAATLASAILSSATATTLNCSLTNVGTSR
jgi:hypothetical protein